MPEENNRNGKVSWKIFVWALGVILILFTTISGLLAAMNASIVKGSEETQNLKVQQATMLETLTWIKDATKENSDTLKEIQKQIR